MGRANAGNALTDDTLNGQPVTIDQVTLTVVTPATSINGGPVPSVDPATGVVSVPAGTPAGDYAITYQICEVLNPSNCDTAIITVTVEAAPIDAVDDTGTATSTGGTAIPNVLVNDTLNGQPATLTNVTLTQVSTSNPNVTLDPATGAVNVAPGTPAGTYTVTYQICEQLNPANCDTAVATVTVTPAVIAADPNEGAVTSEDGGIAVPNVLVNDTLGGQVTNLGQVAIRVTSPASNPGVVLDPATGAVTVVPGTPAGTYQIGYEICERANPTNCAATRVVITVTAEVSSMRVTKTATPRDVKVGDLVRYTLVIENTGSSAVVDATLIDTPPAGFSYVDDTLTVADEDNTGRLVGRNPLSVDRIDIAIGSRATVTYVMRVGAGVRPGAHINRAKMVDNGVDSSNVATAEVQVVADPMTDETLILGTVWDDRDSDGWQDSAAVSGLKVQGGFAPGAYVANSTTVDRGAGPQPEPDASSPMLHGIALGSVTARQSDADPVAAHTTVIRQTLTSLDFTSDFVLSNDQGYIVRMNAAGETTVEKTGDAAKGLSAAEVEVERKVAQVAGGYQVDYIVRNVGIDERGIPGVRIASVEGLLIETDQYGRYHVAGVAGGPWERGRNYILKVDPATLPPGAVFTTDNPLVRRITPGLPVRFDFGVKLPEAVIEGGEKVVELELGEVIFAPAEAEVRTEYQPVIDRLAKEVRSRGAGEIVIQANGETQALAYDRARAVQKELLAKLDPSLATALKITLRTDVEDPYTNLVTLGGVPVLGTFLFDTDKSTIKPEFRPLLDKIAADIDAMAAKGGESVIAVIGHADRRGSREYNQALGMRRAKAVFDAIAAKLAPATKARLRVDIDNSLSAPTGLHGSSR
ncbi:MAG: OmpA family protein [Xanthomonadaceae bacterium]|nr:OmpA family protein [Xanthomonadaceae bacterium]